jgi:hypothetical protein
MMFWMFDDWPWRVISVGDDEIQVARLAEINPHNIYFQAELTADPPKDDRCELCLRPLGEHTIHTETISVYGRKGVVPTGWDCPHITSLKWSD